MKLNSIEDTFDLSKKIGKLLLKNSFVKIHLA